ncbi:MAG TPA: AAA family ATPase, partial [Thermoguttaceae bacterium]|nr:AAA family ATPase [Thermoguttaceae bacterium]
RIGETEWLHERTDEVLDLNDVMDRFGDRIQRQFGIKLREQEQPDWLVKLRDSLDVHFIKTNRLERSDWDLPRRSPRRRAPIQVVARYARELAEHIQTTLSRYAELSQSLDRSFPARLVTALVAPVPKMDDIQSRLEQLEHRRDELADVGLLDKEEQEHFRDIESIDESNAAVLSVYIDDVEQKLSVFDKLFARIDLFKTILDRRFLFKTISIDKNKGIVFSTPDGAPLSPSSLSSGEQQEVVLLYQLLFKVKPDSLILIDEPELSLHIAWQEEFLKDLTRITSLTGFDVLIATHSPQIISDRWDLTVELTGPNGCERTLPTTQSLTQ